MIKGGGIMLVEGQLIEIIVMNNNIQHFKQLGYDVKCKDKIYVPPEHLLPNSMKKVKVQCDICKTITDVIYESYNRRSNCSIDTCEKCSKIKRQQTCKTKYGYENYTQSPEMKEKTKKTNLKKYGVEYVYQVPEIRDKIEKTMIEKYGTANPMQSEKLKAKAKQTNLERYGCKCTLHSDIIKQKVKESNVKKYGVEYPMQNPEIKAKAIESLCKNGHERTSKQQLQLYEIIKEEYSNAELNYPFSLCSLDILLCVNNIKIDIEYDGWYFHQDKHKDLKRYKFLQSNGFKTLRIKSAYLLPSKQELFDAIDYLINTEHHFKEIILSDWKEGE